MKVRNKNRKLHKIKKWMNIMLASVMTASMAVQGLPSEAVSAFAQSTDSQSGSLKTEEQNTDSQTDAQEKADADSKSSQTDAKSDRNNSESNKKSKSTTSQLKSKNDKKNTDGEDKKSLETEKKDASSSDKSADNSSLKDIKGKTHESETMKYISDEKNENLVSRAETTAEKKLDEDSAPSKKILDTDSMSKTLIPTAHRMTLNYLYADKKYVSSDTTIDSLWKKSQKMDKESPIIGSFLSYAQLYVMKDNPNVYVTFADSGRFNGLSHAVYADFTDGNTSDPKNYNSQVRLDKKTGIIYIPRSLFTDGNGKETAKTLYGQLLVPFTLPKNRNVKNDVDVEISNRRNDIRTKFSRKTLSLSSFNTVTSIPVAEKKTASELSSDKITVYVNDETIPHKFSSGEYEYSQKTGVLKLKIMPSSLYKIRIVLEDDKVSEKIAKTFAEKTYADAASEKIAEYLKTDGGGSSLTFSSENVSNGALYEIPNRNVYYNKADGTWTGTIDDTCDTYRNKYAKYCYYFNSDSEGASLNHIIGDTDKGLSTWRDNASNLLVSSNIMSLYSFLFASPKVGGSKYAALNGASDEAAMKLSGSWPKYLPLHCAHTLAGYNETRYTDSEKSNVKMRILSSQWNDEGRKAKTGDWVVIGFAIDEDTGDQQSQGVYKVKITVDTTEDEDGTVTVEKIWNDNDASDSSRPTPVIYVQKSGSSGDSDKYSSSDSKVCKLTKSGSTWTYEFTLPKGKYRVWEGSLGDSHYISSNPESDKIETETGDICTITNTNLKIRVKKKWNDSLTNDQRKTPNIHISAPESAVYIRSDVIREREQIDGDGSYISSNSNSGRYMNYSFEGVNGSDDWAFSPDAEGYCGIINALFGHDIEKIIYADNITDEKDIPEGAKRIDKNYYNKNARYKVYAWKEGNDVYYWTNANIIKLTNSTRHLFAYFGYITRIDLQKIDTSEMTNMSHMFAGDGYLLTPAEVMNGGYDLKNRQKGTWTTPILDLDLSSFDTSNATAMDSMFAGMAVNYINLKTFNTSKVQNISDLFGSSYIRSSLDMRNFDLSGADYNEHYNGALDANYWESKFYYPADNWKNSDAIVQSKAGAIGDDRYKTLSEIGIAGNFKNPKTPTLKKQQLKYSYKNGDCTISKNGDTWTYTFYVANDDLIYDAWEDELDGYVTNHSKNSKGQTSKDDVLTITNTEIKKRDIKVIKEWNDTDTEHPDVSVQLYRNDESLGSSYKVTLNESNKWTHTWKDLDATDENGNNYRYTVKEDKLSDYINDISVKDLEDGTRVYTITNTKNEEPTNLHVQKIWDDSDNADGLRPARIKVQLYSVSTAGEKAYGDAAILSDGNSWEYFWTNLPTIDDDKNDVTYTAKETAYSYTMDGDFTDITDESGIPEYYSYTSKSDGNIVLINQHYRRTTYFSAEKKWDDDSNGDGIRPSSITVSLYADGVKVDGQDKTLSSSNGFSCSWYELPERKNGKDIIYTAVEENVPSGYTAKYEMSGNSSTITNVHTPEKTEADVSKVWNDENDKLSFRPKAIEVSLKRNGSSYDTQILNAENGWHYKWSDLYKYDSGGNRYSYTVSETAYSLDGSSFISGTPYSYRLSVSDDEDSSDAFRYTLTNTLQKTVNAEKTWNDSNQTYSRPAKITYILYANGQEADRKEVTAADKWKCSWTGLHAFDDSGSEITYSVEEAPLEEYITEKTESSENSVHLFRFTNTPKNPVSVSVSKIWKDADNKPAQRPKAVKVQLYADNTQLYEPVILNDDNSWSYKWTNLARSKDSSDIAYSVKEIAYSTDGSTFKSGIPANYKCTYSETKNESGDISFEVTNTAVIKVQALKKWNDNSQAWSRPDSITMQLYRNGVLYNSYKLYDTDNENARSVHWMHTWNNLPAYDDDGNSYVYTVSEDVSADSGYTSSVEDKSTDSDIFTKSFEITNTPETTEASVKKVWSDSDNKNNVRPSQIKVQLYRESDKIGDPVILSADNGWSYTWENLIKKKDSKSVRYTAREIAYSNDGSTWNDGVPPMYTEKYTNESDTEITITNTEDTTVTVEKDWKDGLKNADRKEEPVIHLVSDNVSNQSTVHLREITKASSSFTSPLFYAFDAGDGSLYNTDKIEYASEITDEKDVPKYARRIDRNYSVRDAKYKVYAWTEKESGSSSKVIKYWTNADRIVVGKNFLGRSGKYIQSVDLEKISFADIKTGTDFLQYDSGNNYKNISGSLTIKNCTFESMTDASYMFSGMYPNGSDSQERNVTIENVSFPKLTNVKNMFTNFYLNNITFKNVFFPKLKAVNGMFNDGLGTLTFDGCHFPSLESISELTSGYAYSSGSSDSLSYGCISLLNMDFPQVTEVNQLVNLGMSCDTGKLLLKNINFRSPVKITNLIGTRGAGINTIEFNNVTGDIVSLRDFLNNDHSSRLHIGVQKIVFKDFDTSHVTDMSYMFSCHSLTDLDLSSFDTSSVRDMSHMFYAPSLKSVNLSSFDTSNVCDMSRMFEFVPAIESVDVSTFDTHKITADTAAEEMFVGVTGEQTIYIGDNWTLSEKDMPYICPSLNNQVGIGKVTAEKYSHTSNVSDDGTQNGSYGYNWSNADIRGSDRTGSSSDAHVITISGAEKLNVSITYESEAKYDRVCMWKGSHPTFSASSNTGDSSLVANLSGSKKSTKTYTVDGDTVTFSFSSDDSVIGGGGYGYYAKIQKIEYEYKIINKYKYKQSIPTYPSSSSSAYIDTAMNDDTVRLRSDDSEICKVEKVNDNKWIYHFYVKDASGKYKAYEDDLHGYSTDHDSANPASLPDAVITNTPETLTGNLQINKQLRFYSSAVSSLISGEIDRDYKFTVTKLDDSKNEDKSFNGSFDAELYSRNDKANGNFAVSPYISYLQLRMEGNSYYNLSSREIGTGSSDITCSDQAVEFKNGKAEISAKAYQSMFIRYLPVGNYKIEEEDLPEYHTGHVVSPPVSHSDGNSVNISIKEGDYLFDSVQNAYVYKDLTLNKILKGRSKGTYKFRIDFSNMSNYYDSDVSFVKVDDDVDYNNYEPDGFVCYYEANPGRTKDTAKINQNLLKLDKSQFSNFDGADKMAGDAALAISLDNNKAWCMIDENNTAYIISSSDSEPKLKKITDDDLAQYTEISMTDSDITVTGNYTVTVKPGLHAYDESGKEYSFVDSGGEGVKLAETTTTKIYYSSQGIITPDSNGNASVEIEINAEDVKNGQAVIHNIPAGARYRITELANDSIPSYQIKNKNLVTDTGYETETQKDLSTKEYTMAKDDSITADFTNVASETGALKISKKADLRDISSYLGKWKMESYDKNDLTSAPLLSDLDGLTASSSAYVSENEMKSTKALTSYTTYVYSDSKKEDCALKTTAAADSGGGKYSVYVNDEKVSSSYPYADIQKGWNKIQILTSGTDITVSAPVEALGRVTSAEKTDSIESSDLPDLEKDTSFNFTITLTNNAAATYIKGEKTFSGVKFTDGIAHISLKAGESKTIENLPAGTDYTVAEDVSSQYIADDAEKSGTINENETAEEKFTNHYISGSSLSLSKKVVNGNDSQSNTSYKFSVKLSGLEKNRQYNIEKTSRDNLYEHRNLLLRSKAGTSIDNYQIVDHAPEIEYSENYLSKLTKNISADSTDLNSGYWMKFSKPLEKGKTYTLSFDYEAKVSQNAISFSVDGGSAGNELSKKIEASTDGKAHYSFTFENTMSSDSKNANDRPYGLLISLNQAANGDWIKFSNMKLEEGDFGTDWTPAPEDMDAGFSSDADGNAEVTVYLKGDEKADFGNLPAAGAKYQITEEYADASCTTSNSAENSTASTDTGIQTINGTESTEFTNTFDNALISLPGTGNRTAMILRLLTMAGLFIAFIMFLKKKINEIEKKHGQNV